MRPLRLALHYRDKPKFGDLARGCALSPPSAHIPMWVLTRNINLYLQTCVSKYILHLLRWEPCYSTNKNKVLVSRSRLKKLYTFKNVYQHTSFFRRCPLTLKTNTNNLTNSSVTWINLCPQGFALQRLSTSMDRAAVTFFTNKSFITKNKRVDFNHMK